MLTPLPDVYAHQSAEDDVSPAVLWLLAGFAVLALLYGVGWQGGWLWHATMLALLLCGCAAYPTEGSAHPPQALACETVLLGLWLSAAIHQGYPLPTLLGWLSPLFLLMAIRLWNDLAHWQQARRHPRAPAWRPTPRALTRPAPVSVRREQPRRADAFLDRVQAQALAQVQDERAHALQQARATYPAVTTSARLDHLVGMAALKAQLLEVGNAIVASRHSGRAPRNGVLLYGEPGNGKTRFAEALAGSLGLRFLAVSFGDVGSRWVNQSAEQLKAIFVAARSQAPCLLFLDEVEAMLADRRQLSSADSESAKTTQVLLTELVAIRQHGVVVVAATNYRDRLDSAAIRDGRFDYKIAIPSPDTAAIVAIVQAGFADECRQTGRTSRVTIDADALASAARRWHGFSAARCDSIGRELAQQARQQRLTVLGTPQLAAALRQVQGNAGRLPASAPSLADLALADGTGASLHSLVTRMRHVAQLETLGASLPAGVLFAGVTRAGKTTAAKALAHTADWAFLATTGTDLLQSADALETLFRQAADCRPCVLFIDEADDLLANRQWGRHSEWTNKFLTLMDGSEHKPQEVLVVVATNYPEQLDPAVLGGGRLTEKILFTVASASQLTTTLTQWLQQLRLPLATDVTHSWLQQQLRGYAIGNLTAILQTVVNAVAARAFHGGDRRIQRADVIAAQHSVDVAASPTVAAEAFHD